ncbi:MAG TPA: hypothetical protein PKO33_06400, partial [Pyrinomonadaceae bacterium]|nr:hypothetical protein [Pyrinomonadaceae bacterium]
MTQIHRTNSEETPDLRTVLRGWSAHWTGRGVAVLTLMTMMYLLWIVVGGASAYGKALANDIGQVLMPAGALIATIMLARHPNLDPEARIAWRRTSVAYTVFTFAQTGWLLCSQILRVRPFPSLADVGFLVFYPSMLFALLSFPTAEQTRHHRRKFILDLVSVMIAGTTVVWYFIVLPTIETGVDGVRIGLNIAYIVGDLVLLLGISTILLKRPPAHLRQSLWIVVAGLVNLLCADVIFAFVTLYGLGSSGPFVVLWVTGPLLLTIASLYQYYLTATSHRNNLGMIGETFVPTFSWLPYVAIFVGYTVLVIAALPYWDQPLGLVLVAALMLTAIVVLRQITAVKENVKLHAIQAARESESHFRTLIENSS